VLDEVTNEAMTEAVNEPWQEVYFERLEAAEENRTSRRSRPGRHYGLPRSIVSAAGPAAELEH
jgi:hypothetical protein